MQVNPYLFYNGNCEEALKYYQKALGAQIEATIPYGDGPPDMPIPADWKTKIMHARITIVCTVLYSIPPTSILGAILLTGYLGGAMASHVRIGSPLFTHTLFGLYLGLMVWGGLWLRDRNLQSLIPFRR